MTRCLTLVCVLSVWMGCRAPLREVVLDGETMGTTYRIKLIVGELPLGEESRLSAAVAAAVERIDAAMSTYRSTSELSRFNAWSSDVPFEMSLDTYQVFETALAIGRKSGGALDVTVGPIVDRWGFGPSGTTISESTSEVVITGLEQIELVPSSQAVRKRSPSVRCDLSAIAKGFAVDSVAQLISGQGYDDFLVEIGGELRASGRNHDGTPWRLGVERPMMARGHVQKLVALSDLSMATSGSYRNLREIDGEIVSHIIDPRTGEPVRHQLVSATVVAGRCAIADAWATAMMVLGPKEGLKMALDEGLAVLLLVKDGDAIREIMSPAFEILAN